MATAIPTLPEVMEAVCRTYGVTPGDIRSPSQRFVGGPTLPRMMLCYLARELTGEPLATIGAFVNRHHSAVHAAHGKVRQRLANDRALRTEASLLMAELRHVCESVGDYPDLYGRIYIHGAEPVNLMTPFLVRYGGDGRPVAVCTVTGAEILSWNREAGVVVQRILANDHREVAA